MLRCKWHGCLALLLMLSAASTTAFAQSAASISGVVKDSDGGVVPGATVSVKNDTTGTEQKVITGVKGDYAVPALPPGTYTVTTTFTGFKTSVQKNVHVAGSPVTIPVMLEIGSMSDQVAVTSSSELINTQTATVAPTLNSDQLLRMPTPTRNALNAVTFLPGVNTSGINRDSTINGLPEGFLSITLDGVSNNDNFLRNTDGFFASVTPRQDAVEAVSVTLAAAGANVGGGAGAVTMAFTTRSGGNKYSGSGYEYYRNPDFNSNYYFNEVNHQGKNQVTLNQFGARFGGPIKIPGLYDGRNRAFFFAHYEQIRFPNTFTKTRTLFNSKVLDGTFRYQFGTGAAAEVREVNLLSLAQANGQISAIDPTMFHVLQLIQNSTVGIGTRSASTDPLYDNFVWQSPAELFEDQPTFRLDFNLTSEHRLSGSYSRIVSKRTADYLNNAEARFPGAPNVRDFVSTRPLISMSLRSTLSANVVNEIRGGLTAFAGGSNFGYTSSIDSRNSPSTFADEGGFALTTPTNTTDWFTSNGPSWRKAPTYSLDETMTWQRGAHAINFGGSVLISNAESNAQQMVPGITLGFNTDFDPAIAMFNTTNFPGASSGVLSAAQATYAVLTGRVASISGQAALSQEGKYVAFGPQQLTGGINVYGMFAQDSWRWKPNVTLTGGLRWDIQTPFKPFGNNMSAVTLDSICGQSGLGDGGLYSKCKFLTPGATGGATPEYVLLSKGTLGYNTDWNNVAPSFSVAWRPNIASGFMRHVLGDPEQATVRGGYSVAYERQGLTTFTSLYGGNPGSTISLTRNANNLLVLPGESWPVLLSQTSRLGNAPFNETPSYPITIRANRVDSLNAFAPDIQVARVQNWTIGIARSLSKDTAVELRYIGNKGSNQWSAINYNTIRTENLLANGFFDEFKLAMANLKANNSSGVAARAGSFAYFGDGSGTSPLPIYLAYLNGRGDYTNPAAYINASTTWANATIAGRLVAPNPNPTSAAGDLDGNTTRRNQALALGYPANFFVLNPAVGNVNVTDSGASSSYHAMQIELRRRLSRGLSANVNYQYAFKEDGSQFDGFSFGRSRIDSANVRHALKLQVDWTAPLGRGKRFGTDMNKILDGVIGGWSVSAVGRVQTVLQDFGNVRLVGMSVDDLRSMYKYYFKSNPTTNIDEVWMLPDDVILNTRRAFSTINTTVDGYSTSLGAPAPIEISPGVTRLAYFAPANSADCIQIRSGDCAPKSLQILTPWFNRFDVGFAKRIDVSGSKNFEVRFDLLNIMNTPNFNTVANPGTGATIFKVTSAYTDASNTYDPGGRIGQLMLRFNW